MAPDDTPSRPRRARSLLWPGVVCAVLPVLPGWLGLHAWWGELFIHWEPFWAGGLLLLGAVFALARRWRPAVVAGVAAMHGVFLVLPYVVGEPVSLPGGGPGRRPVLCVATVNLMAGAAEWEVGVDWVLAQEPDLVVLQEVTPAIGPAVLARLRPRLPNWKARMSRGEFGIALCARTPLDGVEIIEDPVDGLPQLAGPIEGADGVRVTVLGVHLMPPVGARRTRANRAGLDLVAGRAAAADGPVVLLGDLNQTPWSPSFRRFLTRSGLEDPRQGRGVLPTWSPRAWLPPLLPIDHVLVAGPVRVVELVRGPDFGSDHRPLVARLEVG